jgi:hypothetical protein
MKIPAAASVTNKVRFARNRTATLLEKTIRAGATNETDAPIEFCSGLYTDKQAGNLMILAGADHYTCPSGQVCNGDNKVGCERAITDKFKRFAYEIQGSRP